MEKDLGSALLKLAERVPDWQVLSALAVIVLLIIVLAVLKSDLLKDLGKRTRDRLVQSIVRYAFAGVGFIVILTFAWEIRSGGIEKGKVIAGVQRASAATAGSPERSRVGLPKQEIDEVAEMLVLLSRRFGAPAGIDTALEALKAGDPAPALKILRTDVLERQKGETARAETLRHMALLEQLRNPVLALKLYRESVGLDPTNWRAWSQISLLSERQGDNKGAAEAAQKVLDIGQRLKSAEAQGYAHDLFGVIEHNAGRFDRAKVSFGRARDYFSKAGTQVELARATANLARVHYAAQEYDAATKFYEVALSLDSAAQNERGQAADYLGLAEVQLVKGETDKAIGNLQRTLSISEKFEDRHVQSKALSVLGRAYQNRHQPGDLDKAKEAALRALKIKQDNNNPLGIAYEYGNLGRLALAKKDYDEAEKYYLEAIKLSKNRSRFAEAVNQRGLGRIYFEWKKFTLAVDAFRSALEIDRDLPHKADAALDLAWIGQSHLALDDKREACAAWKEAEQRYRDAAAGAAAAEVRKAMADAKCQT